MNRNLRRTLFSHIFTSRPCRRFRRVAQSRLHLESLEARQVMTATISGTVVNDLNDNGAIDNGEAGQAGVYVYLDLNANDQLDIVGKVVEPDHFINGETIDGTAAGVSFSVVDSTNTLITPAAVVSAYDDAYNSTGQRVFGRGESVHFFNDAFRLRMDFTTPVSGVAIDYIGQRTVSHNGVLRAYNANNELLAEVVSSGLTQFQHETMAIDRVAADISYAVAYEKIPGITGRFDALRINSKGSEPWTISDDDGTYELTKLAAGTHRVNEVVPTDFRQTLPAGGDGSQQIAVTANETRANVNFANTSTVVPGSWQNKSMPLDVSNDGQTVAFDVLLIINELNKPRYHDPSTGKLVAPPQPIPFYLDVDGDDYVTPTDAILIINFLNGVNVVPALPASELAAGVDLGQSTETAEGDSAAVAESVPALEVAQPVSLSVSTVDAIFAIREDGEDAKKNEAQGE